MDVRTTNTGNDLREFVEWLDRNGDLTRALGLELDASAYGMGRRAKRFALYAQDGVVKLLNVEAPGEFRVSSAEHMLEQLKHL